MAILSSLKILLILALPFIILLSALNYASFNDSFYEEKFSQYGVGSDVKDANSLHQKVIDFLKGKTDSLPDVFNQREKEHFSDIKSWANTLTFLLYFLIFLFLVSMIGSFVILKINNKMMNFTGKVLIFGGILTILIGLIFLLLVSSSFGSTFESFHKMFFEKGTYIFNPENEIIVHLYPEQIFMDLGIEISKTAFFISIFVTAAGALLLLKSKTKI